MAIEIERRFLVADPEAALHQAALIGCGDLQQGYLGRDDEHKVRVRTSRSTEGFRLAYLTRKTPRRGVCREEFEVPVDVDVAERALASLPATRIIRKRRYLIRYGDGHEWALDFFKGLHAGLVIAEIELKTSEEGFELPNWIDREVTFDQRYGNSTLARTLAPHSTNIVPGHAVSSFGQKSVKEKEHELS